MRCGKAPWIQSLPKNVTSQPARMRCGKVFDGREMPAQEACRNPHECAVAKGRSRAAARNVFRVATRTNALWQRMRSSSSCAADAVATRANALWQRLAQTYIVQTSPVATRANALWQSSPCLFIPMRVMVATRTNALWQRCKMLKIRLMLYVATRTNALWQSRAIVVPEPETPKA